MASELLSNYRRAVGFGGGGGAPGRWEELIGGKGGGLVVATGGATVRGGLQPLITALHTIKIGQTEIRSSEKSH